MKIFLQHCATGRFLRLPMEWVSDVASAHQFGSTMEAMLYANRHGLQHAQLLLRFSDTSYDLRMPIDIPRPGPAS